MYEIGERIQAKRRAVHIFWILQTQNVQREFASQNQIKAGHFKHDRSPNSLLSHQKEMSLEVTDPACTGCCLCSLLRMEPRKQSYIRFLAFRWLISDKMNSAYCDQFFYYAVDLLHLNFIDSNKSNCFKLKPL